MRVSSSSVISRIISKSSMLNGSCRYLRLPLFPYLRTSFMYSLRSQ